MKLKPTLNLGATATTLLQQEQELRPASFLLHVQVPGQATRYILYARNYQGFVVQRRYRGVGKPRYVEHESFALVEQFDYYRPYWQPFLNSLAVAQAGLDASIELTADHAIYHVGSTTHTVAYEIENGYVYLKSETARMGFQRIGKDTLRSTDAIGNYVDYVHAQ